MLGKMTFAAGETKIFNERGDFFRVLQATDALTVYFYRNGAEVSRAEGVGAGYSEEFQTSEFDSFTIYSATAQTVQFASRLGNRVGYDAPPVGSVSVTNNGGAATQSTKTVTSASGLLLAAKSNRRYLLIQNNDAAGIVYIDFGNAATAGDLKIGPGGSYCAESWCPNNAVYAIGSIASNPNVVVIEG